MDRTEYRSALGMLGITQARAGELLGVTARGSRKWANGECAISPTASRLLLLIIGSGVSLDDVEAIIAKGRSSVKALDT